MSRICVKNLPKYVAEDRLRDLFSQKGEITDVKLMRTKDGKSRQFCFIGFRTEDEAKEAIKYFNRSYLDTCRITCEVARKVGDPDMPRPWSRHSLKKGEKVIQGGKKDAENRSSVKAQRGGENLRESTDIDDPQLQEFLQVMQPRAKTKLWANDTSSVLENVSEKQKIAENKSKDPSIPKHDELVQSDSSDDGSSDGSLDDGSSDSHESEKPNNLVHDDAISDMEYFKSRVAKEWSDSENSDDEENNASVSNDDDGKEDNDSHGDEDEENFDDQSLKGTGRGDAQNIDLSGQEDICNEDSDHEKVEVRGPSNSSGDEIPEQGVSSSCLENEKGVFESCRLFVRNLPYTATEEELEEHFSNFGTVSQVHLVVDKDTKRSKGIAYILYTFPEFAARALKELDNSIFQGRLLHVLPAVQRPSDSKEKNTSMDQSSRTFKKQREEERKAAEASGDTRAWNSLFMRPDTVVENIARKYGVSKSDLLDQEANDLAVRIALGETQVIAETKKALKNAGVNVESLEEFANGKKVGVKRSNHVLLVKNLPYGSSENELAKMFGKFGNLDKIILPPTKTLALIVYLEPAEARAAFRGLAYKRFKDAPLYLEWAPSNVLSQSVTSENNEKSGAIGENEAKRLILEQHLEGVSDMDIDQDRVEARSLFVKNLNFRTSDESLKNHFSEHVKEGRILSAKVKKHLKNGKQVSMGFGFLEFDSVETATNVCRDLQGTVLDGHALILQLCHAKDRQLPKTVEKDKSSTKLLVRNVAFEATEKELRQLFSPFGQIKSLRLPMKFGSHRGFAFVEYVTQQEAQNALKALSSTHLYGRHLVLERAKEGESLEELRARTAAQFGDEQNGFQKLSKKRKHLSILDEGKMMFERIVD
ncbi:multiple RNA-binding domain-containing protein 1 [Neltuma alba]|uniref:multiple RNA-binding domain-containing protein 1 n=1 Tax=Neltuma alba TaxID=207710 RepID=UPI0010A2BDE3|nr:multiple RNA-binding domain-containing protein 1 [Prosopis alba]